MSRLDKLFGPSGDGRSSIGSEAEIVSILSRIIADIDRLKRGAYRGPGASFRGPIIIDDYRLEFIDESLVATKISTGTTAQFGSVRRFDKAVFLGDEFIGFPPNSSTWGSSPYGSSGSRWQDMVVQNYKIPVQVDGAFLSATTSTLLTTPRAPIQSCDLLVVCVGSHDMLNNPATIPGGSSETYLEIFRRELVELLNLYNADEQIVVFPWGWFSAVTDWPTEYGGAAQSAAAETGSKFIDLNELATLSSSYVVNPASTTNSTPSLDGNQIIFAEVQAILDA